MQTALFIEYFDFKTEYFVGDIDISEYDLKKINNICPPLTVQDYNEPPKVDYQYFWGREIDEKEFNRLKKYINELQNMDFSKYMYSIGTFQVK